MMLDALIFPNVFLPIALISSFILYRINKRGFVKSNYMLNFGLCLFLPPLGWLYFLYSVGNFLNAQKTNLETTSVVKHEEKQSG